MNSQPPNATPYRGRLAPSPTGFLHLGHARTFWIAQQRAVTFQGTLILRIEDLDRSRCKPEFVTATFEDLAWFGLAWQEGPDIGGPCGPYCQNQRLDWYREAFERLRKGGFVYPCTCSRQDVLRALQAPHQSEDEPLYPGTCRPGNMAGTQFAEPGQINWRFQVPDHETIGFIDGYYGPQRFVAGEDFGDFVVWRHDNVPAYHLAVVADDSAMQVTEVVRGADLLKSTARQLLLYRALGWEAPSYYHCPLVTDESGVRLAKRHESLSLRALRESGVKPEVLRQGW